MDWGCFMNRRERMNLGRFLNRRRRLVNRLNRVACESGQGWRIGKKLCALSSTGERVTAPICLSPVDVVFLWRWGDAQGVEIGTSGELLSLRWRNLICWVSPCRRCLQGPDVVRRMSCVRRCLEHRTRRLQS